MVLLAAPASGLAGAFVHHGCPSISLGLIRRTASPKPPTAGHRSFCSAGTCTGVGRITSWMPPVYPMQPAPRILSTWACHVSHGQGVPMPGPMPGLTWRTQACQAAQPLNAGRAGSQGGSRPLSTGVGLLVKPLELPLPGSAAALSGAGLGGGERGSARQGGWGGNRGLRALGTGQAGADVAEQDDVASVEEQRQRVAEGLKALSAVEMKALRAHAHRMGDALVSQQVGKWGVTDTLVAALDAALEANEILKVRVSENSPEEVDDLVSALEQRLHARVVGRIGRALLVYRPSLTPPSRNHRRRRGTRGRGREAANNSVD